VHSEGLTPLLEEGDTIVILALDTEIVESWEAIADMAALDAAHDEE
jgi:hypothetical protein